MATLFCGEYELMESSDNVKKIHKSAFAGAISKVIFHTGILESTIFDIFSRAACTLSITKIGGGKEESDGGCFVWNICFGEDVMAVRQVVQLNKEFDYSLPISGETVKVCVNFSKADRGLKQTAIFSGSQATVVYLYSLFPGGMNVTVLNQQSGLEGIMRFKKKLELPSNES